MILFNITEDSHMVYRNSNFEFPRLLKSPRRFVRKQHSAALGISNCTVRRILREELNFHLYKLAMVQEEHGKNDNEYLARTLSRTVHFS